MSKPVSELKLEFVDYKRATGCYYENIHYLDRFATYCEENYPDKTVPTKAMVTRFIDQQNTPYAKFTASKYIREFCKYLVVKGYSSAYVIPVKDYPRPEKIPPYFFSEEEIQKFFEALDNMKRNKYSPGLKYILPAIFRLLYCCGLRCVEARTLLCSCVNLQDNFINILESKGHKSRRIYITKELSDYLKKYDRKIARYFPGRMYFFPCRNRKYECLDLHTLSVNFTKFWMIAFPDFVRVNDRPRAYDFRHHFAWANINKWASDGEDLDAKLIYLKEYMGHEYVTDTLYYFHLVHDFFPDLIRMAGNVESVIPEVEDEE